METAQVGPVTGNVLFYTKPEPLSREEHGKLGVLQMEKPYGFAAIGHVVPLTVAEFGFAGINYPIIFAGEQRVPLAVMGVNAGENLFVKPDGGFATGGYIPAYIRRYPFVLASDETQNRMVVCIERNAPMLGENAPVPLFDDKGEPSDYTQSAIKFCEDFETERRRTEAFVDLLTSLDLFETKQASFQTTLPDGSQSQPVILADYFGVSEEKLGKLSAEKLAELRDSGALDKIYSHMASLLGWDRLVMIASERAGQQG